MRDRRRPTHRIGNAGARRSTREPTRTRDQATCQIGVCTPASVNGLVFSEINPGLGTVELFNGGSAPVNLLNYSLQYSLGDGGSGSVALPSFSVPSQGFVVFGKGPTDAGYLPDSGVNIRGGDFALRQRR